MEQANSSCDLPVMLLLLPGLEELWARQMSNVNMLYIHPSCHYLREVWLESTQREKFGFGLVQLQEWDLRGHRVITPNSPLPPQHIHFLHSISGCKSVHMSFLLSVKYFGVLAGPPPAIPKLGRLMQPRRGQGSPVIVSTESINPSLLLLPDVKCCWKLVPCSSDTTKI